MNPTLSLAEIVAKAPDPIAAIQSLGKTISRSQMMGPIDRQEIGEVIVMLCITQGLTLAELFRTHQISFGKIEKRIDAGMAEFLAKGGKVEWLADGSDGIQARAKFTLGNDSMEAGCTVEEAKKAGWTRNTKWITEPTTMLRARTKKRGLVAIDPGIFFGEHDDERSYDPVEIKPAAEVAKEAAASVASKRQNAPAAAPKVTTAETPALAPETPAAATAPAASSPILSDELQESLLSVIGGGNIAAATRWAVSVGWLNAGETLEYLSEKNARNIIAKPDRFKAALDAFTAKEGGAK
jgi:hypothetical protein